MMNSNSMSIMTNCFRSEPFFPQQTKLNESCNVEFEYDLWIS